MLQFLKAIAAFAITTSLSIALAPAAGAAIYDPNSAFAAGQPTIPNPAGQFSVGHYVGGTLTPATYANYSTFDENIANTGLDAFYSGSCCDPNILYNDTGSPFTGFGFTMQSGDVTFGPSGGPSVIRFTAPAPGQYQVDANFLGIQDGNNLAKALVFQNLIELGRGDATTTSGYTYSGVLTLAAGDTVDFVAAGSNSGFGDKTTKLTASLTTVPEPTCIALAALGGIVLMGRRGR